MKTTMADGTVTHEMLAADVALVYRWNVTPEGEGMRLDRDGDGWRDADTGQHYTTIADAERVYDGE
jgi:hypothetical protein